MFSGVIAQIINGDKEIAGPMFLNHRRYMSPSIWNLSTWDEKRWLSMEMANKTQKFIHQQPSKPRYSIPWIVSTLTLSALQLLRRNCQQNTRRNHPGEF